MFYFVKLLNYFYVKLFEFGKNSAATVQEDHCRQPSEKIYMLGGLEAIWYLEMHRDLHILCIVDRRNGLMLDSEGSYPELQQSQRHKSAQT